MTDMGEYTFATIPRDWVRGPGGSIIGGGATINFFASLEEVRGWVGEFPARVSFQVQRRRRDGGRFETWVLMVSMGDGQVEERPC